MVLHPFALFVARVSGKVLAVCCIMQFSDTQLVPTIKGVDAHTLLSWCS